MKRKSARLKSKLHLKAWKAKLWTVWERGTWYRGLIHFCNKNATIMWLKHYGKPRTLYMLENKHVLELRFVWKTVTFALKKVVLVQVLNQNGLVNMR